jgi:hypothetical protein
MKTLYNLLSFSFLAVLSLPAYATVRTVSNWTNIPAQYTSIQSAIDAATAGDTVYVHGSPNTYPDFVINRRISIIGPGFYPTNQNQNRATVSTVFIYSTIAGAVNNINVVGMYISYQLYVGYNSNYATGVPIEGLRVNRCFVNGLSNPLGSNTSSSLIVEQSIFSSTLSTDNFASVLVNNTIFNNARISSNSQTDANTVVTNCLFYGNGSGPSNISNTIFSNNIFYLCTSFGGESGNTFNRNLTYGTDNNTLSFSGAITTNTLVNTDPLFITPYNTGYYGNGAPGNNPLAFFNDGNLLLQAGSPAINQGTDSKDIGPTGGTANFNYRTQSMSAIPQMVSLIINNSTLPQNGTLNVQFSGSRQN